MGSKQDEGYHRRKVSNRATTVHLSIPSQGPHMHTSYKQYYTVRKLSIAVYDGLIWSIIHKVCWRNVPGDLYGLCKVWYKRFLNNGLASYAATYVATYLRCHYRNENYVEINMDSILSSLAS